MLKVNIRNIGTRTSLSTPTPSNLAGLKYVTLINASNTEKYTKLILKAAVAEAEEVTEADAVGPVAAEAILEVAEAVIPEAEVVAAGNSQVSKTNFADDVRAN